jgi:hypothetical protein
MINQIELISEIKSESLEFSKNRLITQIKKVDDDFRNSDFRKNNG